MKEKLKKTDTGKKPIVTNMKTICDKCNIKQKQLMLFLKLQKVKKM